MRAYLLYMNDIRDFPLLSIEQEITYVQRMQEGDSNAKIILIQSKLRLVVSIAFHYINRGLDLEDLIQEGNMGLMRALLKFDLSKECRLSTYATFWVHCYIRHALAFNASLFHSKKDCQGCYSLDASISQENASLGDFLQAEDSLYDTLEKKELLQIYQVLFQELSNRQVQILLERYPLDGTESKTYAEIGEHFGITRQRAFQIECQALQKIRSHPYTKTLKQYID